jgi:hypothetical protein
MMKTVARPFSLILFFLAAVAVGHSQTPFTTDNADVTDKGKFHFEFINEFDQLQPTSFPAKYQNGTRMTLAYGVAKNVEVSITGQFLDIVGASHPRAIGGISDTTIAAKYNFRMEKENSMLPAFTISAFVQIPTGNSRRGLGSGVTDIGINAVAQKTISKKSIVRVNAGTLFSGNTLTGAIGFTVVRGQIFTGAASYVRTISERLQLGGEIAGALPSNFNLNQGQLQTQFGGNYQVAKKTTFDFGLIAGRFAASPRFGIQLGFSHDF